MDRKKTIDAFGRLCQSAFGGKAAHLSIPAQDSDDDLVVGRALRALFDHWEATTRAEYAESATKAENREGGPAGSENPDQEWDSEIVWDPTLTGQGLEFPLPFQPDLLTLLSTVWPAMKDTPVMGLTEGMVRVWGLAPTLGDTWVVQATGPDAQSLLDAMEQDEPVAIRLGWAHPDALDRLPEFEGW